VLNMLLQPVLNMFRSNTISLPLFNFLLVDEAQSFDRDSLSLLCALARHVTMVVDDRPFAFDSATINELHKISPKRELLGAFRCSPFIINLAAHLINDINTRNSFIQAAKTVQREKETPTLYLAQYEREERERLIEVLRNRLIRGESIAILLPREDQLDAFAERLKDPRIVIKRLKCDVKNDGNANLSDFADESPKLLSYENARGLSFDTVILPNLTTKTFADIPDLEIKRMLFTGITRATKWVFISALKDQMLPLLRPLVALSAHGLLNIQQAATPNYQQNTYSESEPDLTDIL
jgi:superfamily I DNA/RNA helicase